LRSLAVLLRAATILGSKGRRQGLFNMFSEEQRSELKAALTADYLGRERATELPPELEIGSIIARDRRIDTMFYEIMCYSTDEMQGSGVLADPQNPTVVFGIRTVPIQKIKVGISEQDGSLPFQGLRPWRPLGSLKWIL
jgi:hypothetical protein